ncbi:hypothetical protein [Helicobacter sp. MIT 14-3879]|uniref:hypothetical protein n=1 Tax=Helicobacter sp. MIT 14-3879 TaxID=2040649 RepID=UPI0011C044A0|nr:hypothetical protein [Helicobacter sp. MIT 14-3879]
MQAIILTEAGNNFGLGHLSRCTALKNFLQKVNFNVEIYNRGDFISDNCINFNWLAESEAKKLESILKNKPLVIIDSYYANFEFCKYLVDNAKVCVFFDDFSRMKYPRGAIIFNGALNASKYYIDVENTIFSGIEYGLLRNEFLQREVKTINKDITRVLIALGGNDYNNNTQKVLEIIEKEIVYADIDVVVSNKHKPLNYGFNTNIHSNISARVLKNLMLDCDLAISGGGVTMVELQSTCTPTIALEIASNQSYQLRAWQKVGLRVANNTYQIKSLLKTLKKLKDRNKLHNKLLKINIGEKIGEFIQYLVDKYNS